MKHRLFDDDADLTRFSPSQINDMQAFKQRVIEYERNVSTLDLFDELVNNYPDDESWTERYYWEWAYLTGKLRDRLEKMEKEHG